MSRYSSRSIHMRIRKFDLARWLLLDVSGRNTQKFLSNVHIIQKHSDRIVDTQELLLTWGTSVVDLLGVLKRSKFIRLDPAVSFWCYSYGGHGPPWTTTHRQRKPLLV